MRLKIVDWNDIPDTVRIVHIGRPVKWSELIQLEPEVANLLRRIKLIRDAGKTESFCANAYWYGYGGGYPDFRAEVTELVGWSARKGGRILRSSEAYDTAYDRLYDALPDCRGECMCCGGMWVPPVQIDRETVRAQWSRMQKHVGPLILERDGFACQICGSSGTLANPLTVDHIVPVALGGLNTLSNLQACCRSCNSRKGARA